MLDTDFDGLAPDIQLGKHGTVDHPHRITIAVSHHAATRQMWSTWFRGARLLIHSDPEYASCRELLALGYTGQIEFWHRYGISPASVMGIEAGAQRTTSEGRKTGPATREFSKWSTEAEAED